MHIIMKRVLSLTIATALIAACSAPDDVITDVTSGTVRRVAGITVVNELTGNTESYIPHYDGEGRLFFLQHYMGEELYEEDTLHYDTGSVIIENRNHSTNTRTFTQLEMKNGLAVRRTAGGETDDLAYRDGFLVSDSRYNKVFTWKNGDYVNYFRDGTTSFGAAYRIKTDYSWTAHKNLFASDEFDPSLTFGGYSFYRFYGKRCAHLPAKVEYDYGEAVECFVALEGEADGSSRGSTSKRTYEYSYTFDEEGLLSKISVTMKTEFFTVSYPEKNVQYFDNGESVTAVYIKYAR